MKKPSFLKGVKKVHLTGIKGVGMLALACCFQDLGLKITGSDVTEVFVTDEVLKRRKIKWRVGFDAKQLERAEPDLLITTGAHGGLENPQVKAAEKQGIKILTHAQALGQLMEGKEGVSVCGVGGKTTTCSMLATVLATVGKKPSFAIGVGEIDPLGDPGRYTNGRQFIAEADEYVNSPGVDERPRFSFQNPKAIIVTNIEHDHPDVYKNLAQTKKTFVNFFAQLSKGGLLVACRDNANTYQVVKGMKSCQTYGFSPQADWQIEKIFFGQEQVIFSLAHQGAVVENIRLRVPGKFNALNAAAVFAVGVFLGLDAVTIKKGLANFGGSKRRFELIGEKNGVTLYDDYAHHPAEIKATLAAAKQWLPGRRIIIVFQPHTYSRTKALLEEFSRAFSLADQVIITSIYASVRENKDPTISGRLLASAVSQHHRQAVYRANEKAVSQFLAEKTRPGDVIFTLGAGDIFLWHKTILKSLPR